jgi:hypothetical protein
MQRTNLEIVLANKILKIVMKISILKIISFFIPESFNTNISHQLFDYTITFVNSQH